MPFTIISYFELTGNVRTSSAHTHINVLYRHILLDGHCNAWYLYIHNTRVHLTMSYADTHYYIVIHVYNTYVLLYTTNVFTSTKHKKKKKNRSKLQLDNNRITS